MVPTFEGYHCSAKVSFLGCLIDVVRPCFEALLEVSQEQAWPSVYSFSLPPSLDLVRGQRNGISPPIIRSG